MEPPSVADLSLNENEHAKNTVHGQVITPFDVSGEVDEAGKLLPIDYDKLIATFGASPMTPQLLERFERVTGHKPHRFMRRGIVFSQRDLSAILDRHEKKQPFFLYTGRGPSSDSMHLGHAVPFTFTRWLQEVFNVPLVIMLSDDEKFFHSTKIDIQSARRYTKGNIADVIALGFDMKKTFIFSNLDFVGGAFYENMCRMAKRITLNSARATFGFDDSHNIGEFFFCATQAASAFATSFPHIFGSDTKKVASIPCLIPCAIDQDPYFRQCRDHAEKLKYKKPSMIHSIFLPALQGPGSKMSASIDTSAIFMGDTPNQIKKKINKYAISGGQDTAELQRELGGNTKNDMPFQYLTFFLEDDEELAKIKEDYESGRMLTGEIKAKCISEVQTFVKDFQDRRAITTEDVVNDFMRVRPLVWGEDSNTTAETKEENK